MPRFAPDHVPSYRFHKQSGQAIVTIAGKDHLLGKHDTAESRQKYHQLIGAWFSAGRPTITIAPSQAANLGPIVSDLIASFWQHAQTYYRDKDGDPTSEIKNLFYDMKLLRRMYGTAPLADFDSAKLDACRGELIRMGITRKSINRRINRIRHIFKWGVSKKLIPAILYADLKTLDGLKVGRSQAKETLPVTSISEAHVKAVMNHTSRHIAAMIELQMVTGMRSGELVIMRTGDIDRTGDVWAYTPSKHKTEYLGHTRTVYLGGRAKEIVSAFLKLDPLAYIFSPADADAERRAAASAARRTPQSCGNIAGSNRKAKPKRKPGTKYTRESFAKAVAKACKRAFPAPVEMLDPADVKAWHKQHHFHPHRLRHTAGTAVRREFGLEAVQAVLGQKTMQSAEVYAEVNMAKAREAMARIG